MGSSSSKEKDNKRQSYSYNYPIINDLSKVDNNLGQNADMDFRTKYPCHYNKNSLKNSIDDFRNNLIIQDSFYEVDNKEDNIYEELKKKEKNDLTYFFNTNNLSFIVKIEEKMDEILNKSLNFDKLTSEILNNEKAEQAYSNKIKREINKLNMDKRKFEIKYLTVMLVGKSGVGKSTLINNLLKLDSRHKAITGTGKFQTIFIQSYQSEAIPILRLVDTRGIELNIDYGANKVKADAEAFINQQINSNDPNNFVQCIWYCITGNRFEQVEIDLLNSLKNSYEDNKIPIIVVYTQAVDNNTMNEMQKYIKEKNIDANFIRVLAERKELVNHSYLEAFGMDELIKVTLDKCKKAMRGEMRSVMTKNISKNINEILINENSYIIDYIYQQRIIDFVSNYRTVRNDNDFLDYIIYLINFNIKFFLNKEMSKDSENYLKNSDLIKNILDNYIKCYKNWTNEKMTPAIQKYPIELIDYQVKIQKEKNKDILIKNKRMIKDFIENIKKFLSDNFYYCAQVYFIYYFILNISIYISNSFVKNINSMLKEIIFKENIQNLISECFLNKFSEFEKRVAQFFSTYKNDNDNHNYDFHLNNYDFNNQNSNFNNDDYNYPNNLPSRSEVYGGNPTNYTNLYPNI